MFIADVIRDLIQTPCLPSSVIIYLIFPFCSFTFTPVTFMAVELWVVGSHWNSPCKQDVVLLWQVSVSRSSRKTWSMLQSLCFALCITVPNYSTIGQDTNTILPHTTVNSTITHIHKLEARSQLKLFISTYEMRLLFLSPSLSLSGGIHMDKRRGKWVFRGAITSSQGGNNGNNVLYEARNTVGHTGWLTKLASGTKGRVCVKVLSHW